MRNVMMAAVLLLAAPAAVAQDVDALERQLDKAREAAPMTVRNFMLATRPAKYFGDFESRSGNVVGKDEQLNFYAEPRNLVPKVAGGVYEVSLEVDIEVKPE